MIDPLRLSFEVACPTAHAFDTWTRRIGVWWPTDHTVSGERGLKVTLEGKPCGRIFERTASGAEHEWGEVVIWEPPRRLVYLWHLRRDRADATEVEITFTEVAISRTRVDIEHRGWENLGAGGEEWRNRTVSGWNGLIPHYLGAI